MKLASLAGFLPALSTTAPAAPAEALPVLKVGKVEVFWQECDQPGFKPYLRKVLQHTLPGLAGLDASRFRFAFLNEFQGGSVFDADTEHVLLVFHRDLGSPRDVAEAMAKGAAVMLFEYDYDLPVEEARMTFELYYGGQRYPGEYSPRGGPLKDTLIEEVGTTLLIQPTDSYGAGGLG
jgi:hypothetical protein